MEFIHESIIQGSKVLEALRAGFLKALEEEDLMTWIKLFEELSQVGHCEAAGRDTQHIVHQPLNKLLGDVIAGDESLRQFAGLQKFVKRHGLSGKRDWPRGLWHYQSPCSEAKC